MKQNGLGRQPKKKRRLQWKHWMVIIIVVICVLGFTIGSIIILNTQGLPQGTTTLAPASIIFGVVIGMVGLLLSYLQLVHPKSANNEQAPNDSSTDSFPQSTTKQPENTQSHDKAQIILEPDNKPDLDTPHVSPTTPASTNTILPRVDWGESPQSGAFYGRDKELNELTQWLINDHCQLIALVGIGGIGKTALAAKIADQTKGAFTFVFWRSLQNAPPLKNILQSCIQFVSNQTEINLAEDTDHQISLLLDYLRVQPCLLILDNVETIMQVNNRTGLYKPGYEDYGRLFQRLGETKHKSCLLLTSREKPKEIAHQEGITSSCRSIQLTGLDTSDGSTILEDKALYGPKPSFDQLIENYVGNPLALKLVSQFIKEAFDGNIEKFLVEGEVIFSDIKDVLDQQFERLSPLEQDVMYWLAIEQEASTLQTIQKNIVNQPPIGELQEARRSLRRRSMVETSTAGLLLQNVIMQYMLDRLIDYIAEACKKDDLYVLNKYAILKAQSRDYVRESQSRLILTPLGQKLQSIFTNVEIEEKLIRLLDLLHANGAPSSFYAAGNILTIALHLLIQTEKLNFSYLTIRQAYLQGITLQNINFSHVHFIDCIFTDTFGSILSVKFNAEGNLLAVGTTNGQVKVWDTINNIPLTTCIGHTDWVRAVDFIPNGQMIASGSEDQTIRIWDRTTGYCLKILQGHTNWIRSIQSSPDGQTLASGSDDQTVRLWDIQTGQCTQVLQGHTNRVWSVAFSSDRQTLASGSDDQTVRLWDIQTGQCTQVLQGHTDRVYSVAFSSDGMFIVSSSEDQTIRLWDVQTGQSLHRLEGHTNRIRSVAFSPDGRTFASGSEDQTIRLWDTQSGQCINVFQGHTNIIWSITYSPDGLLIASGSHDQTVRFWEISSKKCIKLFQGYNSWVRSVAYSPDGSILASDSHGTAIRLWDTITGKSLKTLQGPTNFSWSVAYSPDGKLVASGSEDQKVHIWNVDSGKYLKFLSGHTSWVRSVAFSPDGLVIASGSEDHTTRLWDVHSGKCLKILQGHTSWVRSVAFSPDGLVIATGSDDNTIRLWNVDSGQCLHILREHSSWVWSVAFNPTGTLLASGSHDHTICLWDIPSSKCITTLSGHSDWIWSVAFSPDGKTLASGSHDRTIRLWRTDTYECIHVLSGHSDWIQSVAFNPNGKTLASGCIDGTINLWDLATGKCLRTLIIDRPYERMNITSALGLTDLQKETLKILGAFEAI